MSDPNQQLTVGVGELWEIIYRAEKQLLQDRVKCINGILCNNEGKLERSRSRLLDFVTTTTTTKDRCMEFINKVREARFTKMKIGKLINSID